VALTKPAFASVKEAMREKDVVRRIHRLLTSAHADRGRQIARDFLLPLINYARRLTGVIGEAPDIETGMVYGLNHKVGPLGLAQSELGPEFLGLSKMLYAETGDSRFQVIG
jgi:hypothetical protein